MDKHPSSQGLIKLFAYYKELAEKSLAQVKDEDLHCVFGDDGNSIAVLIQHIAGNLRSRFTDALHRQLAHYAYHVGQIVLLARAFTGADWVSLSIPRGGSGRFNAERGL